MELGDLNTLMLRDDEYNYRHNKKLLKFIYDNNKEIFSPFENFEDIFLKENEENGIKENDLIFPMVNYRTIKFSAKKIFLKILFKDILLGMKYIFSKGISHRDIKPENIVYSSKQKCCKVIDFSISTIIQKEFKENTEKDIEFSEDDLNNFYTKEPGGSIHFQAPEQYEIGSYNPFLSDIWSLGISLYIFLFEDYPFDCNNDSELELQMKICNDNISFPKDIEENIINFIESILQKDPNKRIRLNEILEKLEKI